MTDTELIHELQAVCLVAERIGVDSLPLDLVREIANRRDVAEVIGDLVQLPDRRTQ